MLFAAKLFLPGRESLHCLTGSGRWRERVKSSLGGVHRGLE